MCLYLLNRIKFTETQGRFMIARGYRRGGWVGLTGCGVSFWGVENVPQLDRGDGCTTL